MTLYVIMAPPCSGKSTWALERARPGDVVIDLDRIAVALSGPGAPTHGHDGAVDRPPESMRGVEKWHRSLKPRRHSRDW